MQSMIQTPSNDLPFSLRTHASPKTRRRFAALPYVLWMCARDPPYHFHYQKGEHVLDTIPCYGENSCKKRWSRAQVFVVRGRALHLVAAFHFFENPLENRKCI